MLLIGDSILRLLFIVALKRRRVTRACTE